MAKSRIVCLFPGARERLDSPLDLIDLKKGVDYVLSPGVIQEVDTLGLTTAANHALERAGFDTFASLEGVLKGTYVRCLGEFGRADVKVGVQDLLDRVNEARASGKLPIELNSTELPYGKALAMRRRRIKESMGK